jgi:hypothetical protein
MRLGEAALHVLGYHVDVLKVALDQVTVKRGSRAAGPARGYRALRENRTQRWLS